MDTNADSSPPKPWALWAALTLMAAGLIAVLYVLFAAASKPEPEAGLGRFARGEMSALAVLDAPPPLSGRTIQNAAREDTTLGAFTGQVMVVNLWATWCAPCVEEMPTLGALQRRFGDRIRVIPVSVDREAERAYAERELARLSQNSLPFLIDTSRGVLFDLRAGGMPVTIIYSADGRELARLAGGADWASEEAIALIEAVLAGG